MTAYSPRHVTSALCGMTSVAIKFAVRILGSNSRSIKTTKPSFLVGALLALLAMVNVLGLSSWHSAMLDHDDNRVVSVMVQQQDGGKSLPNVDLHMAAHSVTNGFADIAPIASTAVPTVVTIGVWFISRDYIVRGLPPEALLRPPRG